MSGKIFISYRRDDSAPHALSIGQYLEHEFGRRNVFIDVDMYAGARFPVVLEQRLASCKVMLVLIGPRWLNALDEEGAPRLGNAEDWVRLEVASALKRCITVIPVKVGGAELPKKSLLPQDMRGLLDHQAITVSTAGFRNEMAGLVRDIRAIPGRKYQRTALAVSIACVVAMLIGGLWTYKEKWLPASQSQVTTSTSPPETTNYSEKDYPALRPGPEWVLYGIPPGGYLTYFDPDSIRVFPNRVALMNRSRVDQTKGYAEKQIMERAAYHEWQQVLECNSERMAVAKTTMFDVNGQPIYNYKWGDPEFLDLSIGSLGGPGTIAETIRNLACSQDLRKPYIQRQELSEMPFIPLADGADGKGVLFYRPETLSESNVATTLILAKWNEEQPTAGLIPQNVKDSTSSTFKYAVNRSTLDCEARTLATPKIEYYTADGDFNYVT